MITLQKTFVNIVCVQLEFAQASKAFVFCALFAFMAWCIRRLVNTTCSKMHGFASTKLLSTYAEITHYYVQIYIFDTTQIHTLVESIFKKLNKNWRKYLLPFELVNVGRDRK